jgi:hypothetical protein
MATVPQLLGLTFAQAAEALDNNGFGISAVYSSNGATSSNDGQARSQSPAAGTNQPLGTVVTVTFYDYSPPSTVVVPNVVGNYLDYASAVITNAGLVPSENGTAVGATVANDYKVKTQYPEPGFVADYGSTVTLTYYTYYNWLGLGISAGRTIVSGGQPAIAVSWTANNQMGTNATFTVTSAEGVGPFPGTYTLLPGQSNSWFSNPFPVSLYSSYTFTIQGSGVNGTESNQVTIPAEAVPVTAPSWTDNTLAEFRVGEEYSDSVSASGTSPTYSVSSGSLPAGITISGGALSGTPTTKGAYSFTITASNSAGSISASFSGTVGPPKGGVYVLVDNVWSDSTVKTLDGSGGSTDSEVWFRSNDTWLKSF